MLFQISLPTVKCNKGILTILLLDPNDGNEHTQFVQFYGFYAIYILSKSTFPAKIDFVKAVSSIVSVAVKSGF